MSDSTEALERALGLADDGDWAGIVELLSDYAVEDDVSAEVLCCLGLAERELGLSGVAYERFKQALALDPQDPAILTTAGNALAAFDDPDAEAALRAGALLGRERAASRWMYGAFLTREGMVSEARAELDAALELDPHDPVIFYESAVWHLTWGDPEDGIRALYQALDLDADDGWTHTVLGLALVAEGRIDESALELDLGARLREDDAEAQILAALAHAALEFDDGAWEMLERGRLRAEGTDALMVSEAEERMEDGPDAARRLLKGTIAPSALRERLAARP